MRKQKPHHMHKCSSMMNLTSLPKHASHHALRGKERLCMAKLHLMHEAMYPPITKCLSIHTDIEVKAGHE